ncbi:hypothetical protein [Modicisalibacter muralis]|uniref:hypothetical protein n=1 Tax=Modicisalibacter muralis TaxID=119000 RepID=UPI000B7C6FD5|nr:hypothetical protein [Halomonas muralis]
METVSIRREVIDDTIEALEEHAATLRALSQRISTIDQQAAHSTEVIAHELWELRKELADTRHRSQPGG